MKTLSLTLIFLAASYFVGAQTEPYARLADDTQTELFDYFRSDDGLYYKENNGTDNQFFHYWRNAHALDVLLDAYLRTDSPTYRRRMDLLVDNWVSTNGGSLTNDYYDDMEWFTLALFRAYEATGDDKYLAMSTELWDDIKTGENDNQGGGIAWRKTQLDYKNTPANAPAIIYACRRHQAFGHTGELDLAINLYRWLKNTLVTDDGRVRDGINRQGDGQIDDWQFTYNYGTFAGAALELYQSTGDSSYLNDAVRSADYAIQSAGLLDKGVFKDEGGGDGALFNVQVWPPNGSNAQKLRFEEVSSGTEGSALPDAPAYAGARSDIRLYPNPVRRGGQLTIELPPQEGIAQGVVFNANGQKVARFTASSGRVTMPTDHLGRGMYLVVVGNSVFGKRKFFVE